MAKKSASNKDKFAAEQAATALAALQRARAKKRAAANIGYVESTEEKLPFRRGPRRGGAKARNRMFVYRGVSFLSVTREDSIRVNIIDTLTNAILPMADIPKEASVDAAARIIVRILVAEGELKQMKGQRLYGSEGASVLE
jgi:hypothetical protein